MNKRVIAAFTMLLVSVSAIANENDTLTHGKKGVTYNTFGNTTFGSDGSTTTKIGNQRFTHYQNGDSSTSTTIGNQTFNYDNNGNTSTSSQIGTTLFNSDGSTVNKQRNMTFKNGSKNQTNNNTCITIGDTTFC